MLSIKDLHISREGKEIVKGLSLDIKQGEIHALMGPNGSGKSTLSYLLAGDPKYISSVGGIEFNGKNLLELKPNERAKEGLFLAFQYPVEIPGVKFSHFLYNIVKQKQNISPIEFHKKLADVLKQIGKDSNFVNRELNVGFSGGEKKCAEVLQLLLLKPKLAILDETDSGLDVDALQLVAKSINSLRGPDFSALLITHYPKMLEYLKPDFVHIILDGKIVMSGDFRLVEKINNEGYGWLVKKNE